MFLIRYPAEINELGRAPVPPETARAAVVSSESRFPPMPDSRPHLVRFGPFVCDTSTGELWKSGRPIRLQEQPRQLLAALLQQPGEVLSRDELRRRLWTDGTFVDFDNALNVGIRKIREALGDDAPTARYVETVRGMATVSSHRLAGIKSHPHSARRPRLPQSCRRYRRRPHRGPPGDGSRRSSSPDS
jgi:hypothetical protein